MVVMVPPLVHHLQHHLKTNKIVSSFLAFYAPVLRNYYLPSSQLRCYSKYRKVGFKTILNDSLNFQLG